MSHIKSKKNSFDINFYAVLMIGALAFMIFIMGCNPSTENNQNDADSTVSMDENDMDTDPGDSYMSTTGMRDDETMKKYVNKYPDMQYTYVQTEDGKVATVKGNYQVKVDGIDDDQDLNNFVSYVEQNYANKEMQRKEFNKSIETPAKPKNGYDAFYEALKSNIEYPEEALNDDVGGTVFVEFVVDENGKITEAHPMEGMYYTKTRAHMDELDEAAVEAVNNTQWTWSPALQGNKPVKMKLEIPITFDPEGRG